MYLFFQAWRRKAKRLAMKNSSHLINTGPNSSMQNKTTNRNTVNISEELLKNLAEGTGVLGTSPVDAAAHLKLLGDSLTVIGQRLIEHEVIFLKFITLSNNLFLN